MLSVQAKDFKEKLGEAIAREFEDAVVEVLIKKTILAIEEYGVETLIVAGGVSANSYLKEEIEKYWSAQSKNQLHDQLYHLLLDHTSMTFPENFLKRWLQTGGDKPKTAEQAEAEFPTFSSQLKWTLISDKIIIDNKLEVSEDDLKAHMKEEVMRYFGQMGMGEDMSWLDSYLDRMMKDEKQVDATYRRMITERLFDFVEKQVKTKDKKVTPEDLNGLQHNHQH